MKFTKPQLATLRDDPPDGDEWLHERKYDGYRLQALIKGDKARLMTRNEKDWTGRYPKIAEALGALNVENAAIDGELVAMNKEGRSDFGLLQNAADERDVKLVYYAFDLLHYNGENLRSKPQLERKEQLKKLLKNSPGAVRYSAHKRGGGAEALAKACKDGYEGIVSKKADAPYRAGRGTTWIKTKCTGNDEFIIVGYRRSDKKGRPFSSLLLGVYDDNRLIYRGRVGTGFDEETLKRLSSKMKPLERKTSPFAETPKDARDRAVWLTPKLVAQIAYTEVTSDGRLRHPSFLGLREDKPADEVKR